MVLSWVSKELLASIKMNQMGTQRMTRAEQELVINAQRLNGNIYWNDDDGKFEIYHSGTGANFFTQTVSNLLYRQATEIGVGSTKSIVVDEPFLQQKGIMDNKVYFEINYIPQVSQAGEVEVEVTDGSSPINTKDVFSSEPSPNRVKKTFEIVTTTFSEDDDIQLIVRAQQAIVREIVIRGV